MQNNSSNISRSNFTTDVAATFLTELRRANLEVARYFAIVLTVLSVYVFAALVYHWYRRKANLGKPLATNLCLLSGGCTLLLCLNKLFELWIGVSSNISCTVYHFTATGTYGIGLAFVYTTVWIRQRKLYSDDLLIHTVSKISRTISAVVIIIIYCLLLFVFASFIAVLKFERPFPPCHIVWYPLSSLLPLVIFFISTCFVLQLVLFLLLVIPLRRDSSICGDVLCSKSTTDIHSMLKRLALCACCCIFSTILLSIAILLDAVEIICIYWGNLLVLDLLISTLATICSFADWADRILPMFPRLTASRNDLLRRSIVLEEIPNKHNLHNLRNSYSTSETKSILVTDIENG